MQPIRKILIDMLVGEHAHVSLEKALEDIPYNLLGVKPNHLPYSIWQLTEHIRLVQWDIVEFSRDENHISPPWPEGLWPKTTAPKNETEWNESIKAIKRDRQIMIDLISDPSNDLMKAFPYGDGQTLMREAILIIDHTSYHTGEILVLRRLLGIWPH